MLRNILAVVMALLLLGVQHEVQWHDLKHLAEWRQAMQEKGLQDPDSDALCVECLLLAAAANAAPAGHPPPLDQTLGDFVLVDACAAIRPAGVPAYYSSRAPPVQL
ncbi:MAG: hypothetical protein NOF05_21440 [Candidatus Accumulibacter phosphatis]|uniref:DUF2946 domain-containing protein n=3 Tax=Candidatus Accumulibacter TaxID=327159 RepID=A0A7D5NCK6_9PROT|nr:hypothetical protein [Accumulibacter sp.]MCC2868366.1 hypothetical protein [Candidatus Accumulibacter phosphatis]QLH52195.1 MAG: hypothetical protein HWD57_22235 [Candidatus Accumulibacter cognatus]MBL8401920.1 hypothetical protein [Accumulibacter sp.]MBN8518667.1 hypothetical protein [Accumulibacter sp.]MBO3713175.1 hypothetical protein [Accumulibacter sp.]